MGTTSILSETLFRQTRGAILRVLYGHVGESFYLRQLARLTNISLGPVQREIRQLVEAGLVTRKTVGTQTLYGANEDSPVFREIRGLVKKTVGMHDVLAEALEPLRKKVNVAFVYGSVASSRERRESDVDLMVVGNVDFDEVVAELLSAERTLHREINPTVYTAREFHKKANGSFLKNVMEEKKLFIIGGEDDLRELGQE